MGKAKQKRHKPPKPLPTGLPSVRDLEREDLSNGLAEASSSAAHTVASMIDKLTSPSAEEREYACTVIANCVGQTDAVKALLGNDGIRGLAPLIIDPNNHIRQSALGALRNLSVDGGPDVCKELVLKDVLTPLIALLSQYGVGWTPEQSQSKRKPDVKVEIFIQALHLLANLCESTELAVSVFNKEKLLRYLLPCLDPEIYGFSLAIAAAQCLYSVSEDNPEVATDLSQTDNQCVLERLASCDQQTPAQLLLRTLALGVLCNSSSPIITQAAGNVMVAMVAKLTQVITQDPLERLKCVTAKLNGQGQPDLQKGQGHQKSQNGNINTGGENGSVTEAGDLPGEKPNTETMPGPKDDGDQPEEMEEEPVASGTKSPPPVKVDVTADLEEVQFLLTAQQVALELVTNLCVAEDGSEDWEDLDSSCSSSDDATSMDAVVEDSSAHDGYNKCNALCLPTEIHSAFTSNDLLGKVLLKADFQGYPDDIRSVLEDDEMWTSLIKSQKAVQSHALLCINNLVTSLETEGLGGADNLHRIWLGLLQISTAAQGDQDSSLLEAVTSAMRAVIQKLASLETNKFTEVTAQELEFIFKLGQGRVMSEQVRVNTIRISSTIGCILATVTEPHPVLKDIGLFLVGVACQDDDLWVTAEALDSIFDVFGEDHLDPLVQEIGLVEKLQKLVPLLKSKMSSQRKHLGEHYPVISTARTNLVRFIKYKTSSRH